MAAGLTALFGAPLGRAFLALEILHHQHFAEYIVSRLKVTGRAVWQFRRYCR